MLLQPPHAAKPGKQSFEPEQEVTTRDLDITSVPSKIWFPQWLSPMTIDKAIDWAQRIQASASWPLEVALRVQCQPAQAIYGQWHASSTNILQGQDHD